MESGAGQGDRQPAEVIAEPGLPLAVSAQHVEKEHPSHAHSIKNAHLAALERKMKRMGSNVSTATSGSGGFSAQDGSFRNFAAFGGSFKDPSSPRHASRRSIGGLTSARQNESTSTAIDVPSTAFLQRMQSDRTAWSASRDTPDVETIQEKYPAFAVISATDYRTQICEHCDMVFFPDLADDVDTHSGCHQKRPLKNSFNEFFRRFAITLKNDSFDTSSYASTSQTQLL